MLAFILIHVYRRFVELRRNNHENEEKLNTFSDKLEHEIIPFISVSGIFQSNGPCLITYCSFCHTITLETINGFS
jgi:hypothetical protein